MCVLYYLQRSIGVKSRASRRGVRLADHRATARCRKHRNPTRLGRNVWVLVGEGERKKNVIKRFRERHEKERAGEKQKSRFVVLSRRGRHCARRTRQSSGDDRARCIHAYTRIILIIIIIVNLLCCNNYFTFSGRTPARSSVCVRERERDTYTTTTTSWLRRRCEWKTIKTLASLYLLSSVTDYKAVVTTMVII